MDVDQKNEQKNSNKNPYLWCDANIIAQQIIGHVLILLLIVNFEIFGGLLVVCRWMWNFFFSLILEFLNLHIFQIVHCGLCSTQIWYGESDPCLYKFSGIIFLVNCTNLETWNYLQILNWVFPGIIWKSYTFPALHRTATRQIR